MNQLAGGEITPIVDHPPVEGLDAADSRPSMTQRQYAERLPQPPPLTLEPDTNPVEAYRDVGLSATATPDQKPSIGEVPPFGASETEFVNFVVNAIRNNPDFHAAPVIDSAVEKAVEPETGGWSPEDAYRLAGIAIKEYISQRDESAPKRRGWRFFKSQKPKRP